jgi:hypothetical protein
LEELELKVKAEEKNDATICYEKLMPKSPGQTSSKKVK